MDQLPRLGKRELICLLLFACNCVVSVWRGFFFLWVLGMGLVVLLWQSLSFPYNYFALLGYPKIASTQICKTFILTVRNLAAVFGAKTTHFDVITIRKMNFQALTKNFSKISKLNFWSKIAFFFKH